LLTPRASSVSPRSFNPVNSDLGEALQAYFSEPPARVMEVNMWGMHFIIRAWQGPRGVGALEPRRNYLAGGGERPRLSEGTIHWRVGGTKTKGV
jgi:hypothetical protein